MSDGFLIQKHEFWKSRETLEKHENCRVKQAFAATTENVVLVPFDAVFGCQYTSAVGIRIWPAGARAQSQAAR